MDRSTDTGSQTEREANSSTSQIGELYAFESVTTHDETNLTVGQIDPVTGPPSIAVASLIAAQKDCDPRDLSVMYDTIDPDALDTLFTDDRAEQSDPTVSFTYEGYDVTVSTSSVSLRPIR